MSYWDTSALAKLYVQEPDSILFEAHIATETSITVSETGRLELRAVLRRREAEGAISRNGTKTLHDSFCSLIRSGRFAEQVVTPDLVAVYYEILDACLSQTPPIFLRTNDGLHLAAAKLANEPEVVSTDKGMRKAALFLGFTVFPPSSP
jgi:predicted nucleic acid-binding protein